MIREYVLSLQGSNTEIDKVHSELYKDEITVMEKYRGNGNSIRLECRDRHDGDKSKGMFADSFALAKKEFRKWMDDAKKEMDEKFP